MRSNLDDFQIVDIAEDESGYSYYGMVTSGEDARYVIQRVNTAMTEMRFSYGVSSNYATAWTNRATQRYLKPNELNGKG